MPLLFLNYSYKLHQGNGWNVRKERTVLNFLSDLRSQNCALLMYPPWDKYWGDALILARALRNFTEAIYWLFTSLKTIAWNFTKKLQKGKVVVCPKGLLNALAKSPTLLGRIMARRWLSLCFSLIPPYPAFPKHQQQPCQFEEKIKLKGRWRPTVAKQEKPQPEAIISTMGRNTSTYKYAESS